jgi:hypothetical protein
MGADREHQGVRRMDVKCIDLYGLTKFNLNRSNYIFINSNTVSNV